MGTPPSGGCAHVNLDRAHGSSAFNDAKKPAWLLIGEGYQRLRAGHLLEAALFLRGHVRGAQGIVLHAGRISVEFCAEEPQPKRRPARGVAAP